VGKLPVGRARPRLSRVLEPLVVREERRIISSMYVRHQRQHAVILFKS
jgi:hypothetical protein